MWKKTNKKKFIAFLTTLTLVLGLIMPINCEKVYAVDGQPTEKVSEVFNNKDLENKILKDDKKTIPEVTKSVEEVYTNIKNIKILGYEDNKDLESKVVQLINLGKIKLNKDQDSITWEEIKKQLSAEDLKALVKGVNKKIDILSFNDIHGSVQETKKKYRCC